MIDLRNESRLLVEAVLKPVQTDRFQPTGFPDLGAATYTLEDGTQMLLVESAQSMANRLETVTWDEAAGSLVPELNGLPYIHVDITEGGQKTASTASLLEAHRINSPYVLGGKLDGRAFEQVFIEEAGHRKNSPIDRAAFIRTLLKFDPSVLLHGVFMSNVEGGRMRLARLVSSFIEARGVKPAQSGGVKNDRINASGDTAAGFGNVPFSRTEYTASSIKAFFNIDLRQLQSYGLEGRAADLLLHLALFKIAKLLSGGMRLRTACDLEVESVHVTSPKGASLPDAEEAATAVRASIEACAPSFAAPRVTKLTYEMTKESAKESKKAAKNKES